MTACAVCGELASMAAAGLAFAAFRWTPWAAAAYTASAHLAVPLQPLVAVPAGSLLLLMGQNCINHAVFPGILGAHPEVALHVEAQPIGTRMMLSAEPNLVLGAIELLLGAIAFVLRPRTFRWPDPGALSLGGAWWILLVVYLTFSWTASGRSRLPARAAAQASRPSERGSVPSESGCGYVRAWISGPMMSW